jgi:hypothetical protein
LEIPYSWTVTVGASPDFVTDVTSLIQEIHDIDCEKIFTTNGSWHIVTGTDDLETISATAVFQALFEQRRISFGLCVRLSFLILNRWVRRRRGMQIT